MTRYSKVYDSLKEKKDKISSIFDIKKNESNTVESSKAMAGSIMPTTTIKPLKNIFDGTIGSATRSMAESAVESITTKDSPFNKKFSEMDANERKARFEYDRKLRESGKSGSKLDQVVSSNIDAFGKVIGGARNELVTKDINKRSPKSNVGGAVKSLVSGVSEGSAVGGTILGDVRSEDKTGLQQFSKMFGSVGGMILDLAIAKKVSPGTFNTIELTSNNIANNTVGKLGALVNTPFAKKAVKYVSDAVARGLFTGGEFSLQSILNSVTKGEDSEKVINNAIESFKSGFMLGPASKVGGDVSSLITKNKVLQKAISSFGFMPGYGYAHTRISGGSHEDGVKSALLFGLLELGGFAKGLKQAKDMLGVSREEFLQYVDLNKKLKEGLSNSIGIEGINAEKKLFDGVTEEPKYQLDIQKLKDRRDIVMKEIESMKAKWGDDLTDPIYDRIGYREKEMEYLALDKDIKDMENPVIEKKSKAKEFSKELGVNVFKIQKLFFIRTREEGAEKKLKELGIPYNNNGGKLLEIKEKDYDEYIQKKEEGDIMDGLTKEEQNDLKNTLKETKGLSAEDIMSKYPDINLKRDVVITDIHGNKSTIDKGEALTPYELKGNKILLQDGKTYIVSKNQRQNIKGQSISGEAKEFAPELKGTEEKILMNKNIVKSIDMREEGAYEGLPDNVKKIIDKDPEGDYNKLRNMQEKLKDIGWDMDYDLDGEITTLSEIKGGEPTKYEQYTLPGGENYKEILIQAPTNAGKLTEIPKGELDGYKLTFEPKSKLYFYENIKSGHMIRQLLRIEPQFYRGITGRTPEELTKNILKDINKEGISTGTFKSSHRPRVNILAHLRMNRRTYKGKKVAFMEELQSDWAREARKKGIKGEKGREEFDNYVDELRKKYNTEAMVIDQELLTEAEKVKYQELFDKIQDFGEGVPSNPLLKNRQELAIKRALKEAVDTNAEYFAWINGEQTAARYNLSKQVDRIGWNIQGNGGKIVDIIIPKGIISSIIDKNGIIVEGGGNERKGKNIADVIGKGIAEKIMSENKGVLEGEGLNIGGERAYNLYDKQVKDIVERLTGKKVEIIDIDLPVSYKNDIRVIKSNEGITYKQKLTQKDIKVGQEIDIDGRDMIIAEDLGGGKFKAIYKDAFSSYTNVNQDVGDYAREKGYIMQNGEINYKAYSDQKMIDLVAKIAGREYDIGGLQTKQQAIRLTPDIVYKIKGEAYLEKKPSGKAPFDEPKYQLADYGKNENETTKTASFKERFGDREKDPKNASKVVDSEGKPLVVYHGSKNTFEQFDISFLGQQGRSEGNGFYFTTDKTVAEHYGKDGKVYEVYLDIKNPMTMEQRKVTDKQLRNYLEEILKIDPEALGNYGFDINYDGKEKAIRGAMDIIKSVDTDLDIMLEISNSGILSYVDNANIWKKVTGYDGVITQRDTRSAMDGLTKGKVTPIFVAFEPTQIKSAYENKGTFDKTDPRIKYQKTTNTDSKISKDKVKEIWDKYPKLQKHVTLNTFEKILTKEGDKAFGRYYQKSIDIVNNPKDTTIDHEVFHAWFDLFTTKERKAEILKSTGIKDKSKAEEFLAEKFAEYVKESRIPKNTTQKLRMFFKNLWETVKSVFGQGDKTKQLFKDIIDENIKYVSDSMGKDPKYEGEIPKEIQDYMMEQIRKEQDPEYDRIVKMIEGVEAREQLIGKVGGKKVNKDYANKQMREREKRKESVIEYISEYYNIPLFDASDKYDSMLADIGKSKPIDKESIKAGKKMVKESMKKLIKEKKKDNKINMIDEIFKDTSEYDEQVRKDKLNTIYSSGVSKKVNIFNKVGEVITGAKDFAKNILAPVGTEIRKISPEIHKRVRQYYFNTLTKTNKQLKEIVPFLKIKELKGKKGIKGMDYENLSIALLNGDKDMVTTILSKYNVEMPRKVLDEIYEDAIKAGFDIGYLKEYFPRVIKDTAGLISYLRDKEGWGYIEEAIRAKEAADGVTLSMDEKAKIANQLLRGFGNNKITIGSKNFKTRSIDVIDKDMAKYYYDPIEGLLHYIGGVNQAIELKKMFGAEVSEGSIGKLTMDLLAEGKITPEQEVKLKGYLQSLFIKKGSMNKVVSTVKNLGLITSMGSPTSAITQIGDFAFGIYRNGLIRTVKGVVNRDIKKQDIGIDQIANEFSDSGTLQKWIKTQFKIIGLEGMDKLGKEALINGAIEKDRKEAKKDPSKYFEKLYNEGYDVDMAMRITDDLISGEITEAVKFKAFNTLLDFQPITDMEMPKAYLDNPNGRIMYTLKTYSIKQIDAFRREVFDKLRKKDTSVEGLKNLVKLGGLLMLLNGTADIIKDVMMGREIDMNDLIVDNLWRLLGLSKYQIYKTREGGVVDLMKSFLPPMNIVDYPIQDIKKSKTQKGLDIENAKSIQNIPFVGKAWYRWMGGGREKLKNKSSSSSSKKSMIGSRKTTLGSSGVKLKSNKTSLLRKK